MSLATDTAWAAVPWVINYQGRLTDTSGKSIAGTYTITFRLYDASSGGAKQWEEQQTVTIAEADNGTFNVILGSVTVLSSVDFNTPMWLSVQITGDSEMSPRQRLTSMGYALNADKVDSLDSSSFLRTDVDTSTSGKVTITRSGVALLIKPTSDPSANTKLIDVQNAAGTSKFSVDLEGDTTVAGDLAVTGTVSGSASLTGTTNASWTLGSGTDATASNVSLLFGQTTGQESLVFQGASTDDFVLSDDVRLDSQAGLRFVEASTNGTDYVAFQAPASIASSLTWTLPSADGSANQVLTTDGSKTLAWSTAGSISGVGDITGVTAGTGMTGGGTSGDVTLTLSTPVSVANGGTGAATLTSNGVLYGAGTSAIAATSAGTTGTVLHGSTGAAPSFSAVSLTADVTGTLPLANGGTNSATLTNCTSGQALTVTSGAVACTSTITASTASADALDFSEFKDTMALDANTTIGLGGFDLIIDDTKSTDVFQLQNAQPTADTTTMYVVDTATANAADLVITPSDGGVLMDTLGAADLDETGASPALTNVSDAREALAIASSPTAAASDGVLKLGRKSSKWEYIWYNSSEDKIVLSASTRVESSSPAYLLFSPPTSSGSTPGSRYGIKFDPEVTPKTLSFVEITNPTTSPVENTLFEMKAGGRMAMEFVNLVRNGSFEAFSAIEKFRDVGFTTGTFQHGATAALAFEGGWDNFAPDEWEWVAGDIVQHSPFMLDSLTASLTTDVVDGKSAVGLKDSNTSATYTSLTQSAFPDGAISQTLRNLKPNTTYAIGVKALVTNVANSIAKVDVDGEDASGQLKPIGQATAVALSTTATSYTDLIGTFTTTSTAGEVTLYLICQQTGSPASSDMCRFDAVQVVTGKSVPEFSPNSLTDSGDQTLYGLLRVARTTDSSGGGGGGILSVDRFVRARGIEFFGEDPGFTGTAGGMGMIGPPEPYPFNPTGAVGTLRLTTSGIYTGSTPREYKVKITTDASGSGADGYTWSYRDMNMTATGPPPDFTQGGTGTVSLGTEVTLNLGVKIKFLSTTSSGGPINAYDGKLNDEWFLYATGVAMHQAYNSFSPTATYTPGESRIYKDPYTNQLMFQDGTTTASLKNIVGAGIGTAARVDYPVFFPAATGGGTMSLSTSQGYTGTIQITFDVEICADGTGTGRDSIRMRNNLVDGAGAATDWDIPCTQMGLSPYTPFDSNPNMDGFQGTLTNYGFSITFGSSSGTYQDGKVGDKWQLAAYPGGSSSAIKTLTGAKGVSVTGTGDSRTVELISSCLNGEILKWNGTTWACAADGGGGGGDVLTNGTNTFTSTSASPIKIKPTTAPAANTKLFDMQATGAGTTNFSVDVEGDVLANSLDLTTPLPNSELDYISAAGKVSGAALTSLASVPSGAGVIPAANTPLGATIESAEITDGEITNIDISPTAAIVDTKLATISTAGKVADTALSATVTKLGSAIETGEITDGTIATADLAASAVTKVKLGELAPSAQATPDKTVAIAAGKVYVSGNTLVDFTATNASFDSGGNCAYTPVASSKFVKALITLTSSNTLACTVGTEELTAAAAETSSLTYPTDKLPIAEVILKTTGTTAGSVAGVEATAGTNSYVYRDVRPFLNLSSSGVTSVAKSGSTALTGAVTFSSSGAITLTQSGQDIAISAPTGGNGDVLTTGTNTLTATTASPIKIKPSSAPTANTKLFDMQATGAGTTNFSVDAEGDVVANGLDLTVLLPDSELATISTAGKVDGAALTGFASIPSGAGVIPAANTPLGATIETGEITDGTIATADVADGAITWAKLNGTTNLTLDAAAADLARTLTITNAAADTATAGTPDFKLILKGGTGQGATTEVLDVQNSAAASLFAVEAGGNIGIGTAIPNASALLDVSSTTKGFLAPRLTTTQRDAVSSPAAGLLIYNTSTNAYNVYNGTSWGVVGGGNGDVISTGTNTFTTTTASPIKIKPSSAPTADTKLFDMQATGAGTTNFSVDAEGDAIANSLDLTVLLPDSELATISTAGKVADSALSATVTKLGATIESSEVTDGTLTAVDLATSAVTKPKLSELAPTAQATPDLTVAIAAGKVYVSGNTLVDATATTANFANAGNCVYTPVAASKFLKALIALTSSNTLACTFGTEQLTAGAAESGALTYPTDRLPLAEVILKTTGVTAGAVASIESTAGTNSYLYRDVRPFLNVGGSGGVTSVAKSGAAALTGAVTFSSSGAITLTQSGQDIAISAPTGGGGDVLTTGTNTFTATTASPILLRPSSAPTANTKLFDVQTTGTTTSVASLDVEGDLVANTLDLAVALPDTEVVDDLTIASTKAGSFTNTNTAADSKALNVSHTGASVGTGYAGSFSKTGASTANVGLYATASGGSSNYAAIFDAGNVGIGTATPNQKLEVGGHLRLNGDGTYEILYMQTDAVLTKVSATKSLIIQPGGDVAVRTSAGSDRIVMQNATGNVGIGTTSPGTALDVRGNVTVLAGSDLRPTADSTTALNVANAAGTDFVTFDTTNSRLGLGTTSPGAKLEVSGVETSDGSAVRLANTTATTGKTWKMISKNDGSVEIVLVGAPDKRIAWLKAK